MLKYIGEELFMYGIVGEYDDATIAAGDFISLLAERRGKRTTVRVNSPGGEVNNGIAIANAISRHPGGVDIIVDAMAASIMSYIAVSGQTLTMTEGSRMMIHNPWTVAVGDSAEFRRMADQLDIARDSLVGRYSKRTGKTEDEIKQMLDATTWMTAESAIENKFADKKEGTAVEKPKMVKAICNQVPEDVELVGKDHALNRTYANMKLQLLKASLGLFDKPR